MISNDLCKDVIKLSDKYNSNIKHLARIYATKKKGTFDEEKAHRNNLRLAFIIATEPIVLMERTGPFFVKHANLVRSKNWDELIKMEFVEEKQAYKNSLDGADKTDEKISGHIRFVKHLFRASTEQEKSLLFDICITLLSTYCEYVIRVKDC